MTPFHDPRPDNAYGLMILMATLSTRVRRTAERHGHEDMVEEIDAYLLGMLSRLQEINPPTS